MDSDKIQFLLDMFGVSVREFIPGHTTFVPLDYLTDKQAIDLAKQSKGAARFITAALSGQLDGRARRRPGLYKRSAALPKTQGKLGHPNNPNVRKQAEALKERFGINVRSYKGGTSAANYIASAEAIRWPEELSKDIDRLSLTNLDRNMSELQTLALRNRAETIERLISMA